MVELPAARRIRRFVASNGTEYDEDLDGRLRRRLNARSKDPIPPLESREYVEAKEGPLVEIDLDAIRLRAEAGQRWRRRCRDCGTTRCGGGCAPKRQKGQRR